MARIRKKNFLDINFSSLREDAVRIAFERVYDFVSNLASHGFETIGSIKARSINLNNGGAFKTIIKEGVLDADDNVNYTIVGKVIGAIGWSQVNGSTSWETIEDSNSDNKVLFWNTSSATKDTVALFNGDSVKPNSYKLIIFYTD